MELAKFRFVIEKLHVARTSVLKKIDDALRFRSEMRKLRKALRRGTYDARPHNRRAVNGESIAIQHPGKRRSA